MDTDVQVLYFGILREQFVQARKEQFCLPPGSTVADLMEQIGERHPLFTPVRGRIKIAVNEDFVPDGHVLATGDTVALIPPIAGGSDRHCVLTEEPLHVDPLIEAVTGAGHGGIVVFIGTVRDHHDGHKVTRLHYEAYRPMVLRALNAIIDGCEQAAEGVHVAVAHRTGTLQIGEAAVVIAASAPHRAEAFAAARTCIERLKEEVPIWKKEYSANHVEWVGMRP